MRHKELWSSIWSLKAPQKIKVFIWKAYHKGIPVRDRLKQRLLQLDDLCPCCSYQMETVSHCLINCPLSAEVITKMGIPPVQAEPERDHFANWWRSWMHQIRRMPDAKKTMIKLAIALWQTWKARNQKVFAGKEMRLQDIINVSLKLTEEYYRSST